MSVEAWQIGTGLATVGLTAGMVLWNAASQAGHRKTVIAMLTRQREEDRQSIEKMQTHGANQFLRIFQAIEQLRRLHKTGNGGIVWTDLTGTE